MNRCLKCGRSAGEDQVFCEACLKDMERYPVKPGTPVVLPVRPVREAERRPEKRKVPPAVEIARLRRQRQSLWIAVAAQPSWEVSFKVFPPAVTVSLFGLTAALAWPE